MKSQQETSDDHRRDIHDLHKPNPAERPGGELQPVRDHGDGNRRCDTSASQWPGAEWIHHAQNIPANRRSCNGENPLFCGCGREEADFRKETGMLTNPEETL